MKYNLIMENWRNFQAVEDDRLSFGTKKITYDSLLLKLENQDVDVDIFMETFDRYVTEKTNFHLKRLNEGMLNEGMFKDTFTKIVIRAMIFVRGVVEKFKKFISSDGVIKNLATFIEKATPILRKIVKIERKISKFLGPIGRVAVVSLITMLASGVAQAYGADPDTAQAALEAFGKFLEASAELATDLQTGNEDQASEITTRMTMNVVDVKENGEQILQVANETFEVAGDANNAVDVSNKTVEALLQGARMKINGQNMTPEMFAEFVSKLDAEVQIQIKDAMEAAKEIQETDPQLYQELEKLGRDLYVGWSGDVESSFTTQNVDQTTTLGDQTSTRNVSAASLDSTQFGKSRITRTDAYRQ